MLYIIYLHNLYILHYMLLYIMLHIIFFLFIILFWSRLSQLFCNQWVWGSFKCSHSLRSQISCNAIAVGASFTNYLQPQWPINDPQVIRTFIINSFPLTFDTPEHALEATVRKHTVSDTHTYDRPPWLC